MRLIVLLGLVLVTASLPGSISARAGERIAYGQAPSQFGELWLPRQSEQKDHVAAVPVVVMIHGGCWRLPEGRELMDGLAEDLNRHGVAVWNIEYRRLGEAGGGYPGTFLDVGHAVDMLREVAKKHHLDLAHLVAVGHSAGGELALWAAARAHLPKGSALVLPNPLRIASVVSMGGIGDLKAFRDGPSSVCGGPATIDQLTGAATRPDASRYADTSPRALLPIGVPQLIVAAAKDDIVPPDLGRSYAAAAKAAGDKVEFLDIANSDHFDLIDPKSAAWTQVRGKIMPLLH